MEKDLRIGVITSTHGVHGEVNVFPTTDDLERFKQVNPVIVTTKKTEEIKKIESVKYFKGMAILKLSDVDNMDMAELLKNGEIWIDKSQSPKEEGKYLICDLIGMTCVTEEGKKVGVVEDVLMTAANPVFSIRKEDGKELLLPKIPDCVLHVDEEKREITVYVLPGLED